jgi:hypothetical protein
LRAATTCVKRYYFSTSMILACINHRIMEISVRFYYRTRRVRKESRLAQRVFPLRMRCSLLLQSDVHTSLMNFMCKNISSHSEKKRNRKRWLAFCIYNKRNQFRLLSHRLRQMISFWSTLHSLSYRCNLHFSFYLSRFSFEHRRESGIAFEIETGLEKL